MSAAEVYQTVSTAWTERRLENVLERQKQLAALHVNIKAQNAALVRAIEQDLSVTRASAAEEVLVVLDAVKSLYDELDFPATLRQEQMIKKGSTVSQNLFALGPSLIEPTASYPLSSSLIPLAASIAAGSATILLLGQTTPTTNTLLQKLVHDSFDYEAVAVAPDSSMETKQHLSSRYFAVAVLQDLESTRETAKALTRANPSIRILEPGTGLPAVFVDRSTSDLQAVAAHINRSIIKATRKSTSRIPRLCFVDESIIDKLEACLRTREQGPQPDAPEKDVDILQGLQRSLKALFPATFKQHRSRSFPALISLSSSDAITADSIRAVAKPLTTNGELTLLIPIRSVDHGIDILNKVNGNSIAQAIYIFAEGKTAFYIGQFVNVQHVFVDDIPVRSFVTLSPSTSGNTYHLNYRREDFSINRSIIQTTLHYPDEVAGIQRTSISDSLQVSKIYQPKGGRLSFFEQGLILGLTVLLTATSTAAYLSYRGARYYIHRH